MKTNNIKSLLLAGIVSCGLATGLTSCKSGDQEFPDYIYQTCYFSKQYPLRTVELGNDPYVDLTPDNQHKVQIQAAMGGAYNNRQDVNISIIVDASACDGVTFADGTPVTVMPSNYYEPLPNKITIPSGQVTGGIDVQLTDAFFADPRSTTNCFVIPVRMTEATGVDHILEGKDFVLYAVKYVNRYHGEYILNGDTYGSGVFVTTASLNKALMVYAAKDAAGKAHNCELQLNFGDDGKCTVTTSDPNFTVTGTGRFVEADESQLVGARHPDTMYLDFTVKSNDNALKIDVTEKYVLTLKSRGVKPVNNFQQ